MIDGVDPTPLYHRGVKLRVPIRTQHLTKLFLPKNFKNNYQLIWNINKYVVPLLYGNNEK